MLKALLKFSNGDSLILSEDQLIVPIAKVTFKDEDFVSQKETVELWRHTHDGLIPCILEFLCYCDFFKLIDDSDKVYSSSAVVTVENL